MTLANLFLVVFLTGAAVFGLTLWVVYCACRDSGGNPHDNQRGD